MNEDLIELLDSTANMLRAVCMDRLIPQHAKEVLERRIAKIDAAVEAASNGECSPGPRHENGHEELK